MRKRLFRSLTIGAIAAGLIRVWGLFDIFRAVVGWVEKEVPAGTRIAPIAIELGVLLVAALVFGVIIWTMFESGYGAYRVVCDRRNDGPAQRQFQASLADIIDCRQSIAEAGFDASLFIHSDLYAKLTSLSRCLADLGITSPPVDRRNPALAQWHIRLKALAFYAERGDVAAARRHRHL